MLESFFSNITQVELSSRDQDLSVVNEDYDSGVGLGQLTHNDPYITSYVCLLAPRFEEHLIVGDLSDQLHLWMKDICISFGWKLHFLDVNPKFLHWVMSVSINTYPMYFMKKIRRMTSRKIFDEFPRFTEKNMSSDFWAPWYFVSVGQAPFQQSIITKILEQIRREQGIL